MPADERSTVRVTIFRQSYNLTVFEGMDANEIRTLAAAVDRLMHDIADVSSTADGARVGVLACLHLAERLRELDRKLRRQIDVLDRAAEDDGDSAT